MPSRVRSRDGFAMPITILVMVVLAIGLTGSLSFVTSERRVLDNITQQQNAFLTAQSGLDEFLSNRAGLGFTGVPGASETVTLSIRDGTAEVVLERLRPEIGLSPALYVIRSTGVIPGPRTRDPDARRTVAQLAQWQEADLDPQAGWLALTGLHKNGTAGTISGVDRCGNLGDLPGVSVPADPGWSESGGFDPDGDPPVEEVAEIDELIDELGLDWEAIVNQTAMPPDVVFPAGPWPSFSDPDYWPVIYASGDFTLPNSGRGILIVTGGSLIINGSDQWEGVVLIGEHLIANGNGKVYGATLTGLDAILAADPEAWAAALGQNSVGNGAKAFQYDSCTLASAMQGVSGLSVFHNAWLDNWPAS